MTYLVALPGLMGPFATAPHQLLPGNIKTMGTALAVDSCPRPPSTEQRSGADSFHSCGGVYFWSAYFCLKSHIQVHPFQKQHQPASGNSPCRAPMPGIGLDPTGLTASPGLCIPVCPDKGLERCSLGTLCPGASHPAWPRRHDYAPSGHAVLQEPARFL